MEHFYKNLGEEWFTYPELYTYIVNKFPTNSHFVEVGIKNGEIEDSLRDNLYEVFLKNIEPVKHQINPVKALSWDGAAFYKDNSLDFVFIDAAHDYESVKKDINAWYPKVKKEGIIGGHDYTWCDDVRRAVNEFFKNKTIYESQGCWFVLLNENNENI